MRTTRLVLTLLVFVVAGLAGCSDDSSKLNATSVLRGANVEGLDDGFTLVASPADVVIDLDDPNTPVDSSNDKHYAETELTAIVLDLESDPQEGVPVTFTTTAGALASAGQAVNTDATGAAHDTLRVFEDDPEEIEVTATSGERSETITVHKTLLLPNEPPTADAGADVEIECASSEGTAVRLDGSGSADPNGENDIVLYEWFEGFGLASETKLGEGAMLETTLGLGVHTITLRVTDSRGETATDEVVVTIVDTTPPAIEVGFDPAMLWPPNHKWVHVTAHVTVHDCSPVTVVLRSIESNEPVNDLGDGNTEPDIAGAELDTTDYEFDLRAERSGGGTGRVYTVVYTATDELGHAATVAGEVRVPHDQGH